MLNNAVLNNVVRNNAVRNNVVRNNVVRNNVVLLHNNASPKGCHLWMGTLSTTLPRRVRASERVEASASIGESDGQRHFC